MLKYLTKTPDRPASSALSLLPFLVHCGGGHVVTCSRPLMSGLPSVAGAPFSLEMLDTPMEKPLDVFISYRRSNGSQLARYQIRFFLKGEGGVYKGWNSHLAQWGAIIPTAQWAPGHFEYIYIIMKTTDLCDIISIQIAL